MPQCKYICPETIFSNVFKGYLDHEKVDREITSRRIDASSTRFGTLDELACALDSDSELDVFERLRTGTAGWSDLGVKLDVSLKRLYAMTHYSPFPDRKSTNSLFAYLSVTYPQMAVKSLKKALEEMERSDVLEIIQDQKLEGEVDSETPYMLEQVLGSLFISYLGL